MTGPLLRARTNLVAVAWLSGVTGLSPEMVGTKLPADQTLWATSGFIVVAPVGGDTGSNVPLRDPVVRCDCWAVTPGSTKPPEGRAANLAEHIVRGTQLLTPADARHSGRPLALPGAYPAARVLAAGVAGGPRPAYGDAGAFAHIVIDLSLRWVELP